MPVREYESQNEMGETIVKCIGGRLGTTYNLCSIHVSAFL